MSLLSLRKPTSDRVLALQSHGQVEELTYTQVGATLTGFPEGWSVDEQAVVLGHGEAVFARATQCIRGWEQFDLGWVVPLSRQVPLEEGALFTFVARTFGLWSVNMCRIVYVVDESSSTETRFGFAYGTVGEHSVRGEEQFLLTWDHTTDAVSFSIRKFSLPASVLLKVLGPVTRWVQERFTREALARVARAVAQ